MGEKKEGPAPQSWRDPDQRGRPFLAQLREHRGLLFSALALVLFLGVTFVAVRPLSGHTPSSSVAPSPTAPGVPFFGLYPGLAYDPARHQVVLFNRLGETWLWSDNRWTVAHPPCQPARPRECSYGLEPKTGRGAPCLVAGWHQMICPATPGLGTAQLGARSGTARLPRQAVRPAWLTTPIADKWSSLCSRALGPSRRPRPGLGMAPTGSNGLCGMDQPAPSYR
jgi:hypothetical protein